MSETNKKKYDLEEITTNFAKDVRLFINQLPKNVNNIEDSKQVNRSSGSVAANYIEANEALSKKDFLLRIKICRKEAKESRMWLGLFILGSNTLNQRRQELFQEAHELMMIFGSILRKSE